MNPNIAVTPKSSNLRIRYRNGNGIMVQDQKIIDFAVIILSAYFEYFSIPTEFSL